MLTQEEKHTLIEKEINSLLKQGIKRVDLSIFDNFQNFNLSDDNLFLLEYLLDEYKKYSLLVTKLQELKDPYLTTIKNQEIKSNQNLENINSFVIELLLNSNYPCATNVLIKHKLNNKPLTYKDFIDTHSSLLLSESIDKNKITIRKDNSAIVRKIENNVTIIRYIPIDYQDIKKASTKIIDFYNVSSINEEHEVFTKPILLNGLIATTQLFTDGNTRLARVFQNILLWDLSKKLDNFHWQQSPILFPSEALQKYSTRDEYRNNIYNLVNCPSNETLNNWTAYYLTILEKQLYMNTSKIEKTAKTLNKKIY